MALNVSIQDVQTGTGPVWSHSDQTLSARFERQVILHPRRTALGSGDWQPTFDELNGAANHLARRVLKHGGETGDRIALLMRHDTPLIAAALAVLKAGRTAVVLNPSDPPIRLGQVLENAEPCLILTDRANHDVAQRIAGPAHGVWICDDLTTGVSAPNPEVVASSDNTAFIIYTSGSTGRPKGVMQTHASIWHNGLRLARAMGLSADDRIVLPASLSGGHGVAMAWCALLTGAAVCPFPIMERGMCGLADFLRLRAITVFSSSASVFRHFTRTLQSGDRFPQIRVVRLGSEPATSDDFAAFAAHFDDGCTFLHTFSSSETGNITQLRLTRTDRVAAGRLPIGTPVAGMEVLLLDEHGRQVADGETGELVVRSLYLSAGYWRNSRLTAERFLGTAGSTEARIYRSGDLARYTPEGVLTFLGRKDARFKIRGYIVEPIEIENALLLQPEIEQAVAWCASGQDDAPLVAFVVLRAGQTSSSSALRSALGETLPRHMVPTVFVFVDGLPLTPHGKIDREKLSAMVPPRVAEDPLQPPIKESERTLAGIWTEIFGRDGIDRQSDFFELGGDSLQAAVVTARVHAAFGVVLNLDAFARYPTLSALASVIDTVRPSSVPASHHRLIPAPRAEPLPLSFEQERTWRYSQTPESSAPFTVACGHRIKGPLDLEALHSSMSFMVRRHEMLRTSFAVIDGQPAQIVHAPFDVSVPLLDFTDTPDAEERATLFLRGEARRPFELAHLPLLRFWVVKIRHDEHWLLRVNHHIINDTWSWKVYFRELGLLYEAKLRGDDFPLPGFEPLQYGDYAVWQRRAVCPELPEYQSAITWWKDNLAAAPCALELPFKYPEPLPEADTINGLIWWGIGPEVSRRLEAIGREKSATYYTIRLAAFVAVLAGETGQADVVIGTYLTNRNRVEFQNMFGFFSNLITLRFCCDLTATFRGWVSVVRRTVLDAHAHCDIPYEQLCDELRKQGTDPPEIRAIFGVSEHTAPFRFGGLEITWLDRRMETMPWGFSLTFDQYNEPGHCRVDFDARIYDPEQVRAFLGRYTRFLEAASCEPDRPLSQLLAMADSFVTHS
jgi:amino acid adenylation domain-containing protein